MRGTLARLSLMQKIAFTTIYEWKIIQENWKGSQNLRGQTLSQQSIFKGFRLL